jgi:hypothetical protein
LNGIIPYDKAFKKYFGSFYINEKLIANYAKQEGCNSCLIVYYAVTDLNFFLMAGPVFIVYIERALSDSDNMKLHSLCSLYGWLVSANDGKVLAKSHGILRSFSAYIQNGSDKEQLGKDYKHFMKGITDEMFVTLLD